MNPRKLRDIEVSPIGMGCMGLSHGYGEISDRDYSIEAIRKAYAFGAPSVRKVPRGGSCITV